MDDFLQSLRGLLRRDETERARRAHAKRSQALDPALAAELRNFEAAFRGTPGPDRLILARARTASGEPYWAGLPGARLSELRAWILGTSGSGKTMLALALLLQVLTGRRAASVIVVDFKGELGELLRETLLPAIAETPAGEAVFRRLRIVRPFDRDFLPMLRITEPERDVPREAQAEAIAHALEDGLGDDLGSRMLHLYRRLASLCIERNLPLLAIGEWLQDPAQLQRDAARSGDPALRAYARHVFPRENRASVSALMARFDAFLFHHSTRLILSAPQCLSFPACLAEAPSFCLLELGNPPAGAERLTKFWAGLLLGRLLRGLLTREVGPQTPPALVVCDEWQEGLRGEHDAEQFSRLLTLVRYRRVGLVLVNQQVAQLDSKLVRILRTNTTHECVFRSSYEDARAYLHALPVPASARRPAQAREAFAEELTRLERREFLLWPKGWLRAQRVRSPRMDLDALRRRATSVSPETRAFIRRGIAAAPRAELEAHLAAGERARSQVEREPERGIEQPPPDEDPRFPRLG